MVQYKKENGIYIIDEYTRRYYQSKQNGLFELFYELYSYELKPPQIIAVSLNVATNLIYTENNSITVQFPQHHILCNPEIEESVFNYQRFYHKLSDSLKYIEYFGEVLKILFSQCYVYNSLYLISNKENFKSYKSRKMLSCELIDKLKIEQNVSIPAKELNLIIDYIYNKMEKKYKSGDKLKAVIKYITENKSAIK